MFFSFVVTLLINQLLAFSTDRINGVVLVALQLTIKILNYPESILEHLMNNTRNSTIYFVAIYLEGIK